MISPGFFSLFNSHRSILTAQTALNVINHNVANANTEGYSRQRADLVAHTPYTAPNRNGQITDPLQLGQGVVVDQITRLRDRFIDAQYRQENARFGESNFASDTLSRIEDILAEPSEFGINSAMQNFFEAAQAVSLNPENLAARSDFLQTAVDMVTTFNLQANQLRDLRTNMVGDPLQAGSVDTSILAIQVRDVNEKLANIQRLNEQINTIIATGAQPNDLLDQRDLLMEELSEIVDITVTEQASGQVAIDIGGQRVINGVVQLGTLAAIANPNAPPAPTNDPAIVQFVPTVGAPVDISNTIQSGEIRAILDLGSNNSTTTSIRDVIEDLDNLFVAVTDQINTLQQNGYDLNGNAPPQILMFTGAGPDLDIFNRSVNAALIADPTQLAAAVNDATIPGFAGPGDGRNALAMAQVRNTVFGPPLNAEPEEFLNSVVSRVGIDSRAFSQRASTQERVMSNLDQQRQSISGVNTDEEMIDLLRYQRQLEASSKMVQVFDQVTQTIIGMV